ncbi:sensor histidine kinase [Pelagibius marinus]|uniref:sensor histidine kinase n=1 Tax=Pelagibius marinus TaxID=2762760 RepID=UPI001872CAFB|nr:ATP-binding protein [Pelagibius marinus]
MVSTIERERGPRSRFEATRALLARRRLNLLLPILLLVAVSLVAVAGVLYWSAGSLNEREVESQRALVKTMVQIRRDSLRQLIIDYAWWDEAITTSEVTLDERWARVGMAAYLNNAFNITGGWVIGADDRVRLAFENGRHVDAAQAQPLPQGAEELIAAARSARSIDEVPEAHFVIHGQEITLVAASLVAPLATVFSGEPQNVMVFVQPLDLAFFDRAGVGGQIEDLHFIRGPAPDGYYQCPVPGLNDQVLGHVIWRDHQPGSGMLWNVVPFLAVSLLAVGFLVILAIKRVETVVSREGRLSISLYQEKQRRSQKSDFVSMVSHELRTPLQAIGTSADMLERFGDQMSEGERREEARTIRRAVRTLAHLVDDVLAIGRSEAAQERARERGTVLDLAQFCRAMWREVSLALRSKQELQLVDDIGAPIDKVDELAMHTVLSNLLQNAIKYSRGEGPIKVRLDREDGEYTITVTDFGPGIAADQSGDIFKPYWRAKEVESITGTGLGLAVARSSARALGGDLRLKCSGGSCGPDCGTCFEVRWPACN